MRGGKLQRVISDHAGIAGAPTLSALLSQVLVAFTLELDNEFELRMSRQGDPGARVSLVLWSNLMRFLNEEGSSVHGLARQALAPESRVKFELGCLERWRFVFLRADPLDNRSIPTRAHRPAGRMLRDGWGSGRGIRSSWIVHRSTRGRRACEIWPSLFGEIEQRWQARFGDDQIGGLRESLEAIIGQLESELPQGLPPDWEVRDAYPPRAPGRADPLPLPGLLSQLLLAFAIEFDRESRAPLALCANTLRVLGESPTPVSEIPRLTGASPETSGIGWQIKPYVSVEPDPAASRRKLVRLTPLGLRTQQTYRKLIGEIEKRWETRFGKDAVARLRDSLRGLFVPRNGERLVIAEGLVPPAGTVRAGAQVPALGRRDVGSAARQRARDLVAQTEMFLRDPAGALPHYPLWDMNRGFGP